MISVDIKSCGYGGNVVLENIVFNVKRGEKICIIGPNGSGKTTLVKALVGLIDFEGTVEIDGVSTATVSRKDLAKDIAYMSQINHVSFGYTVYETVLLGRYAKNDDPFGKPSRQDKEIADHYLALLNMNHLRNRSITSLSGGELQRVFLARVFAQDPKILVLDEPTNHLDLKFQIELMEELERWSAQEKRTIVAVLHDLSLAVSFADKLMLLSEGKIAAFEEKQKLEDGKLLNQIYNMDIKGYMMKMFEIWKD